jgi:hypothetical protein
MRERAEAAMGRPKTEWQKFMEFVAEHPVTVSTADGRIGFSRTRVELVGKLRRLKDLHGNRLSDKAIKKVADAYVAAVRRSEEARSDDKDQVNGF